MIVGRPVGGRSGVGKKWGIPEVIDSSGRIRYATLKKEVDLRQKEKYSGQGKGDAWKGKERGKKIQGLACGELSDKRMTYGEDPYLKIYGKQVTSELYVNWKRG